MTNENENQADEAQQTPQEIVAVPAGAKPSHGPKPTREQAAKAARKPAGEQCHSVRVKIKKDETTTIPRRVYEHEIPVLEALFGQGSVTIVDGSRKKMAVGDAQSEYNRMMRVYGRKGENAVKAMYASAADLAVEAGLERPVRRKYSEGGLQTEQQSAARGAGVD